MYRAALGLALGLVAVFSLWADDFWDKKNFAEWTDKEVREMLTNSPWARRVDVALGMGAESSMGGRGGRRGGGFGGGGGGGLSQGGGLGPDEGGGGAGAIGPTRGVSPDTTSVPRITLLVRWQTALPVKQAVARARFGPEAGSSAEAAKFLTREEQFYIIGISGVPGRMLGGASPEKIKEAAGLKIGNLPVIHPVDVKMSAEKGIAEIYLIFSKTQPGARVITLEDKDVEVVAKLGGVDVKRKFRLKDMVFDGKLAL